MIKINVGSLNQIKINSVASALNLYPQIFGNDFEIKGIDNNNNQFDHPIGAQATAQGALNRAEQAFLDCDYSIGIEGGLIEVPMTKTGYMEVSFCVIKTKDNLYYGMGCGFEWPQVVTKFILDAKGDASLGFKELNLTQSEKLGAEQGGIIGMLTNSRINREDMIKQSVIMAMIYLENEQLR